MEQKTVGPRVSKERFFAELIDHSYKDFAGIKEAVAAGDVATCERIFADAMRKNPENKTVLKVIDDGIEYQKEHGDYSQIFRGGERVLGYELAIAGVNVKFEDRTKIDWRKNPTYNNYREITYQLVRFADITFLARYYRVTKDERCLQVFIDLVDAFIKQELCPEDFNESPYGTMTWRTIDTGGRIGALTTAMAIFLEDKRMPNEFICDVYRSLYEHAMRLFCSTTMGNWRIFELNGFTEFCFACPFYADSEKWYEYCIDTLIDQLDKQFYPAPMGVQEELALAYHDGVVRSYISILDNRFEAYGKEIPKALLDNFEKCFEMYPYLARPDDKIPGISDSGPYICNTTLRLAHKYFPHRDDFIWFGSFGEKGAPPKFKSTVVPIINWTVFRSAWERDALWMFFDTGHYGRGHQHDDQLNILLFAYGKEMITEVGNASYDASEMRKYAVSSRAHNTVMLGGKEMNDRKFFDDNGLRENYDYSVYPAPKYNFTDEYEVSEYCFDRGYGADMEPLKTTRKVIFVKDGAKFGLKPFFVVIDRFEAPDDTQRRYDIMWHLPQNTDCTLDGSAVSCSYGDGVGLKMLGCDKDASFVNMKGQLEPYYQGFIGTMQGGVKDEDQIPIDTPVFVGEFKKARRVVTVLYPYDKDDCKLISTVAGNVFDDTDVTLVTENGSFTLDEKEYR